MNNWEFTVKRWIELREDYLPRFFASASRRAYFMVNLFSVLYGDFLFLFLLPTPVSLLAMHVLYTISQQLLRVKLSSDSSPIPYCAHTVFKYNSSTLHLVSSKTAEVE